MKEPAASAALGQAVACAKPKPIEVSTQESALKLSVRYGFSYYDSLIAASALEAGCKVLLTEELQAGQVIEGRLTVVNPLVG